MNRKQFLKTGLLGAIAGLFVNKATAKTNTPTQKPIKYQIEHCYPVYENVTELTTGEVEYKKIREHKIIRKVK